MTKTEKRFKDEAEIVTAIDACHATSKRLLVEAEELEERGLTLSRQAETLEGFGRTIKPVYDVRDAIRDALPAMYCDEATLTEHLRTIGLNFGKDDKRRKILRKKNQHWHQLDDSTLVWVCGQWGRVAELQRTTMRETARDALKKAKRYRAMADNQLHVKAHDLGKLLAVMQTTAMPFLPETNKAHDISIPAL